MERAKEENDKYKNNFIKEEVQELLHIAKSTRRREQCEVIETVYYGITNRFLESGGAKLVDQRLPLIYKENSIFSAIYPSDKGKKSDFKTMERKYMKELNI